MKKSIFYRCGFCGHILRGAFFLIFAFFVSQIGIAQTDNKGLTGLVTDTANNSLANVTVKLIQQKDTLMARTNSSGQFTFGKIKKGAGTLHFSLMGYDAIRKDVQLDPSIGLDIGKIKLIMSYEELEEVVVKPTPPPMTIKQDTIEYHAAAYNVNEGDNVAELLRQFSGIEVDDNLNVTSMGEPVTKLRVNGVDFFTGNVKEFISKLPAEIVAKIQLIDDFGDQANFTDVKSGESQKIINIETKPEFKSGQFGNISSVAGTNNQAGINGDVSFWKETKQSGASLGFLTQDNGAGESRNLSVSGSYRNKWGDKGHYQMNFSASKGTNASFSERNVETTSTIGTYYNSINNRGNQSNSQLGINTNFAKTTNLFFINGNVGFNYSDGENTGSSVNNQRGVIMQDFLDQRNASNKSPNVNMRVNLTRKLKNPTNMLSSFIGFSNSNNSSFQNVSTNILYYNQEDGSLEKDSVLNRNIDNENGSYALNFGAGYIWRIGQDTAKKTNKNLSINYGFNLNNSKNRSYTSVYDQAMSEFNYVDSLSSNLSSLLIDQSVSLNFNQQGPKGRLVVGLNARPVYLNNYYLDQQDRVINKNLNYSPTLNFSRNIKKGRVLTANYSGNNSAPSPSQLQPIRNTENLQNMVIGNPDLKPFFQHRLGANYNITSEKKKSTLLFSGNFTTTQDEIVRNIIIIPDTLGSFRQETHFVNTNGTFDLRGNYAYNRPFMDNKIMLRYSGAIGYSNRALFIDNARFFNKGLNLSQSISGRYNKKKFSIESTSSYTQVNNNNIVGVSNGLSEISGVNQAFNPGQFTTANLFVTRTFNTRINGRLNLPNVRLSTNNSYTYSSNINQDDQDLNRVLQTISLSLSANLILWKRYSIDLQTSKRLNQGYALANQNPFIINVGLNRNFLKDQSLQLSLRANDLLKQQDMINRQVSGNSIVDSRSNVVTRVFSLSLTYNLSTFGGQRIRVNRDPFQMVDFVETF